VDRLNPYAFFDCLALGARLQQFLGSSAPAEFHLFSYLACLLSLYRGKPASAWGYGFAGTPSGSPFSPELESAKDLILRAGYGISEETGYLRLSRRGLDEFRVLRRFGTNRSRDVFLVGACSSILALPVGIVRAAVGNSPELRVVAYLRSARPLLSQSAVDALYDDFQSLHEEIGTEIADLMIPAVIWLRYMAESMGQRDESLGVQRC